jgi:class 3 adenylate cyclase/tetratricopeptide (TPR) repeat protein
LLWEPFCVTAQEHVRVRAGSGAVIDSLKGVLPTTQGVERVKTLRALAWENRRFDLAQSLDFGLQAVDAARASKEAQKELPDCLNVLGVSYRNIANYPKAMEAFLEALKVATAQGNDKQEAYAYNNIGDVYRSQRNFSWAIDNTKKALQLFEKMGDKRGMAYCEIRLGENAESQNKLNDAFQHYLRCYDLRRELKDTTAMFVALGHLGDIHKAQGRYKEALQYFRQSLEFVQRQHATADIAGALRRIAATYYEMGDYEAAIENATASLELSKKTQFKLDLQDASEVLWKSYAALRRFREAYDFQHLYLALRDSISSEQSLKQIATLQINYEVQRKDTEIALIQQNERLVRWGLGIGLVLALALAAVAYNRYRIKRAANREILRQQEVLTEQSREIELTNTALQMAITQADKLLLNVLPAPIAERMKRGETRIADHFDNAAVLFADIAGFTELSSTVQPQELVEILDGVFSEFDAIAARYGVEKIKTIGDGYMVVAGVPQPLDNNCEAMAHVALEMHDAITRFNRARRTQLAVRIGIHVGPVVAGVIGKNKFSYDLWGDTVNTASRMESYSEAGKIHVSDEVCHALRGHFVLEPRGEIAVKGKGVMQTWFLVGRAEQSAPTSARINATTDA